MSEGYGGGEPNYEPNSVKGTPAEAGEANKELGYDLGYVVTGQYDHREGNDNYTQAGDLYRLMTHDERERLVENICASLGGAKRELQEKVLPQFVRADYEYGNKVAKQLGLKIPEELLKEEQVRATMKK